MQNFRGVCAPRALGAPLHQKLLGYLCTWSLSEHLHMQTFWGVSAPRTSQNFYHCTSGAFLHPKLLGPRAFGVSHTLKRFTPRTCGVSLHSGPLEHLKPKTFGVSHALGSGALVPQAELQGMHTRGVPEPHSQEDPDPSASQGWRLLPHRRLPVPRESAPRGATAQPQGARGAGREANSYGSARSGAAGEPEGSGTDPCRAVSSRAGS